VREEEVMKGIPHWIEKWKVVRFDTPQRIASLRKAGYEVFKSNWDGNYFIRRKK